MHHDVLEWTMSEQTIVRKSATQGSQSTFDDPTKEKAIRDKTMHFNAHVNVEQLPEGKHLKKATIFSNVPNGGTWELISDEGTAVGGRGSAPSPLMYFAAGAALCMMSHVEMLAQQRGMVVTARLEQKFAFSTSMNLKGSQVELLNGRADKLSMNLILESDSPAEEIDLLVQDCKKACMAFNATCNATPSELSFSINGSPLEAV